MHICMHTAALINPFPGPIELHARLACPILGAVGLSDTLPLADTHLSVRVAGQPRTHTPRTPPSRPIGSYNGVLPHSLQGRPAGLLDTSDRAADGSRGVVRAQAAAQLGAHEPSTFRRDRGAGGPPLRHPQVGPELAQVGPSWPKMSPRMAEGGKQATKNNDFLLFFNVF